MSRATASRNRPGGGKRPVKSIGRKVRRAEKPLCISAQADRASARAARSAGHKAGWLSARYSAMASESQIVTPSAIRTGTLPEGDQGRIRSAVSACRSGITTSSNGRRSCLSSSQGRSDQEERLRVPRTSFRRCIGVD